MKKGFGVDLVVANLALGLKEKGVSVLIGCLDLDSHYQDLNVCRIPPIVSIIKRVARQFHIDTIIAHTSPYYELLPDLAKEFKVLIWEYGDTTPALRKDGAIFQSIKDHKVSHVYPYVHDVVAISKFIARDNSWPQAKVVYLGCDHVPNPGAKKSSAFAPKRKKKVGALMRLGPGEAEYKGNHLLIELFEHLSQKNDIEFHVMGRGTEEFAEQFASRGMKTHLNASDAERDAYLRELDIFVSTSLWEGFNLPLVEAQAAGTMAIALNLAAHPEVTPFTVKNIAEMSELIQKNLRSTRLLATNSKRCFTFVRKKFRWIDSANFIRDHYGQSLQRQASAPRLRSFQSILYLALSGLYVIRKNGFLKIFKQAFRRYVLR